MERTEAQNIEIARELVTVAGQRGSDIVALPEGYVHMGVKGYHSYPIDRSVADTIPGRFTRAMGELASKYRMYLLAPQMEIAAGRVYNSCPIISRTGDVVGVYRKSHPMACEILLGGVSPGSDLPVFTLDFGVIGITICMDIYYPEAFEVMALRGAEVIFWVTMAQEPAECLEIQFKARAIDNNLHLVQSNYVCPPPYGPHFGHGRRGWGQIVDFFGRTLADTGIRPGVATAELDLDERKTSRGCISLPEKLEKGLPDDFRSDLLRTRRPNLYRDVCTGEDCLGRIIPGG